MQKMQARITIAEASFRQVFVAVLLLSVLLSAFFWLGYWTAEQADPRLTPHSIGKGRPTAPAPVAPPVIDQIEIDPKEVVRL